VGHTIAAAGSGTENSASNGKKREGVNDENQADVNQALVVAQRCVQVEPRPARGSVALSGTRHAADGLTLIMVLALKLYGDTIVTYRHDGTRRIFKLSFGG
jgi:hypothetical protein